MSGESLELRAGLAGARAAVWLPAWVPAHRLLAFWLLATVPLLLVPVPPLGVRYTLLALHLIGGGLLLAQRPEVAVGRVAGWARDWLPFFVVPLVYWEVPLLAEAIHRGASYDTVVMGWEAALFGGQPSLTMAARWPSLWISEPLHGAYLSYYFIMAVPPIALWFMGRRDAFRRVVFALAVVILLHQAAFVSFPVLGPRYLFPAPTGPLEAGLLYQWTHQVLEGGSSPGTAFPSSHVGISVAVTVALWRERLGAAPWVGVLTGLLAVATVYGGFHYAVDAVAGVALGLIAAAITPRLMIRMRTPRDVSVEPEPREEVA
jgi:membrane-associated phospholipid phosphatase